MTNFLSEGEKALALEHSRILDVHRWADHPEVNKAVNHLYDELALDPLFRGNNKFRKKHIKVVVLDLYANWLSDKERFIAYHRSPNKYRGNSRYNKLHISYLTVEAVDALERGGYVEHYRGYYDRRRGKNDGQISRMRATDRLIDLIKNIPPRSIQRYQETECIILRDEKKKTIEQYRPTAHATSRRSRPKYRPGRRAPRSGCIRSSCGRRTG